MIFARNELRLGATPGRAKLLLWAISVAVVLAALLARDALAQERETVEPFDLVGFVTDLETGQPLVGAFVALEGSDWGSVTDERGRYRIPDAFPGPAVLTAEQLGYEELFWHGNIADGSPVELRMEPKPVELEGLRVVTDRFRSRRNSTATSVQTFDSEDLATAPQATVLDFVAGRSVSQRTACGRVDRGDDCLFIRGRRVAPVVYVDEHPVLGGLDYLDTLRPHELYLVEIYGWGQHIRVYTKHFMEWAARTRLQPIPFLY